MDKLRHYVTECLATKRWGGCVSLMIIDAALTSLGMNYFGIVVPRVKMFKQLFGCLDLAQLAEMDVEQLRKVLANQRACRVAKEIAGVLLNYDRRSDRRALRKWAAQADIKRWRTDPIGRINGVGINTFQYLRMMGGVDTLMPDKIVRRYVKKKCGIDVADDVDFVIKVTEWCRRRRKSAVALCWEAWLVESGEMQKDI